MKISFKIDTNENFDPDALKSDLTKFTKDELKAVAITLQNAEKVVQKVIDTCDFNKGDYVKSEKYPSSYGIIENIIFSGEQVYAIFNCWNCGHYIIPFNNLEKWVPKEGELCVFWDTDSNRYAGIRIFKQKSLYGNTDSVRYTDSVGTTWNNCAPFINEKQFKEIIDYNQ